MKIAIEHIRENIFYSASKSAALFVLLLLILLSPVFISCGNEKKPVDKVIVAMPEKMDEKVKSLLAANLNFAASKKGRIEDSILLYQLPALSHLYGQKSFSPFWSTMQTWKPCGDSLLRFIENLKLYGLFPEDYHARQLLSIKSVFIADSLGKSDKKDAALWARADLLLSDALVNIIHDINLGRLPKDSITLRKDSVLTGEFVSSKFNAIVSGLSLDSVIGSLEPKHKGYHDLKAGIKNFLEKAAFKEIPEIIFPDSNRAVLKLAVCKRLLQLGYSDSSLLSADSLQLANTLLKFQKEKGLTADGKIGAQTIRELNASDIEKFKRIAITLDRYKMLPEEMPGKYIWVNISAYNLRLYNHDTIVINSRVVVGKAKTRSPVLTSSVYEIVTYPQWTIPQSIIEKEILPAVKKNPGYLLKKGYGLFDKKGDEIDPYTVDWSKYKKNIPYRIIQGSGDDNALGVLKFNFRNNYSVYMHDTNQRFYFGLASRSLSHGCIRVQEWEKMANYILRQDMEMPGTRITPIDSLKHWLAKKEKHNIPIYNKMPVFIRYFTCEGINGHIVFFEDIYNEDRDLAKKLFANKKIG